MKKQVQQSYHSYHSFLVRCWLQPPQSPAEHPIWRFQLQDVSAEVQAVRFSDLEKMLAYMLARLLAIAVESRQGTGMPVEHEGGGP